MTGPIRGASNDSGHTSGRFKLASSIPKMDVDAANCMRNEKNKGPDMLWALILLAPDVGLEPTTR